PTRLRPRRPVLRLAVVGLGREPRQPTQQRIPSPRISPVDRGVGDARVTQLRKETLMRTIRSIDMAPASIVTLSGVAKATDTTRFGILCTRRLPRPRVQGRRQCP